MESHTSHPFFAERLEDRSSYSFLESDDHGMPVVKVFTHHADEQNDRCETEYVDFCDYIVTGNPDGLGRLLKLLGMYIASDDDQRAMSIFVEGLN